MKFKIGDKVIILKNLSGNSQFDAIKGLQGIITKLDYIDLSGEPHYIVSFPFHKLKAKHIRVLVNTYLKDYYQTFYERELMLYTKPKLKKFLQEYRKKQALGVEPNPLQ